MWNMCDKPVPSGHLSIQSQIRTAEQSMKFGQSYK